MRIRLLIASLFLSANSVASLNNPLTIRKSLHKSGKINLIGIKTAEYTDYRYDADGDGAIDFWLIKNKNTRILATFSHSRLSEISIVEDYPMFELKSVYKTSSKTKFLTLSSSKFEKKRNEYNSCRYDFSDNTEVLEKVSAFQEKIETQNFNTTNLIDQSCNSDKLDPDVQAQIRLSVADVYKINITGTSVENYFVHCMADSTEGRLYLLDYLDKLIENVSYNTGAKIKCVVSERKSTSDECSTAKLERPSEETSLEIFVPQCKQDFRKSILKNVFHECLHPQAGEKDILKVVDSCLNKTAEDKTTQAADSNLQIFKPTETNVQIVNAAAPSTVVSPEIAAGGRTGLPALNAGFSGHGWSDPAPAPVALANSRQATSGILQMANQIITSAVVPAAFASTSGVDSTKSAAIFNSSSAATTGRPSQVRSISSIPSSTTNIKTKANLAAIDAQGAGQNVNFDISAGNKELVNSGRTSQSNKGKSSQELASNTASLGRSPASRALTGGDGGSNSSTEPTSQDNGRSPSSTGNKSGSSKKETPTSGATKPSRETASEAAIANKIKNLAPEELQARRNRLSQTLTQKSPQEAWNYIRANSAELKALQIHILDSNNRAWGHQDPKSAVVKILEINHKLISEDN